jgi:hypothetical protein
MGQQVKGIKMALKNYLEKADSATGKTGRLLKDILLWMESCYKAPHADKMAALEHLWTMRKDEEVPREMAKFIEGAIKFIEKTLQYTEKK